MPSALAILRDEAELALGTERVKGLQTALVKTVLYSALFLKNYSIYSRCLTFFQDIQAVACAPVTQQARVRSPVGTSFLGEVFPHL